MQEETCYYIYSPEIERFYSRTIYATKGTRRVFAGQDNAHEYNSPEVAKVTLLILMHEGYYVQVIDDYGEVYYDSEEVYHSL